jgi:hypothetical protein
MKMNETTKESIVHSHLFLVHLCWIRAAFLLILRNDRTPVNMLCEHPTCRAPVATICQHHCHLSLCHEHRREHETNLLDEFEQQLQSLITPIAQLLHRSRAQLRRSEEARQKELNRLTSLFEEQISSAYRRLKQGNATHDTVISKRQCIARIRVGDHSLHRDEFDEVHSLAHRMQTHLHEQQQVNHYLRDHTQPIHAWPFISESSHQPLFFRVILLFSRRSIN